MYRASPRAGSTEWKCTLRQFFLNRNPPQTLTLPRRMAEDDSAWRKWLSWLYNSSVAVTSRVRSGRATSRTTPPIIYITGVGMGPNPSPGIGVARCIRASGSDGGDILPSGSGTIRDAQLVALDKWRAAGSGMWVDWVHAMHGATMHANTLFRTGI